MNTETYVPPNDDLASAITEFLLARQQGTFDPVVWLAKYAAHESAIRDFLSEGDDTSAERWRLMKGEDAEPDLTTDQRFIGDYELTRKIGGNMGMVYQAQQRSLPRTVAVKLLLRRRPSERERFFAEADAMAKLHHPHIARIFEVSRGDGLAYFSMEWCANGTLSELAKPVAAQQAATLMIKIAAAIHFAHQRGVLHRDLKPANILLDEFGEPKVADLGLAISLAAVDANCRGGTPVYMAPEQLGGELTVATDVYGLGAILYELLTGVAPSAGASLDIVLTRVRHELPTPPHQCVATVDVDLSAICMKCLAKDPAHRYPSAAAFVDDLERFRNGLPTVARPLSPWERINRAVNQAQSNIRSRYLSLGFFVQAAFVLLSDLSVFGLLYTHQPEWLVWLALFISYAPIFVILAQERRAENVRQNLGRIHLWTILYGHAIACATVFVALRIAYNGDYQTAIQLAYVGCCSINSMAFIVTGSLFARRQYVLGFGWVLCAFFTALAMPLAPIIYAVMMALCFLLSGLQLTPSSPDTTNK